MKKLLLLGVVLISCIFCINAKAEENNFYYFEGRVKELHWWSNVSGVSFFGENEKPSADIVLNYMAYAAADYFEGWAEYEMCTDDYGEEYRCGGTFAVPKEIYEETLKKIFNVDDDYIIENIRTANTLSGMGDFEYVSNGDDGTYYYEPQYGWGGAPGLEVSFIGYKNLENNIYELYSYLVNYDMDYEWDCDQLDEICYTFDYSEDDVLGEDYIIDYQSYIDEDGKQIETRYAVKLVGYIKSKVIYDGAYVKYLSYEEITKEEMVALDELVLKPTHSISIEKEEINIYANEGVFPENTEITIEKQTSGSIYDVASKALKEKGTAFIVFEINAKAGDYDVEPNGKVTITINVPEGYKNPVIYYVSEDGKLEKIETKVENGLATAEVTHFSTYALVDESKTIADKVEDVVDKVVENVVENPKTGIISGVGIVAVAGGCGAYFYNKAKKKNKFPQA